MTQLNQRGFSHVLLFFLVVIVIGAIGYAGWHVYKNRQQLAQNTMQYSSSGSSGSDTSPGSLPTCSGTALLDHLPTDTVAFTGVEALGHLNGQHVLPSQGDHVEVNMAPSGSGSQTTKVYSPGNVTILQIAATTQTAGSTVTGNSEAGHTDYVIDFAPCSDVVLAYGHVENLNSSIQTALASVKPQCFNGSIVDNCLYGNLKIPLTSGEQVGTAGGPGFSGNAFDFGAVDDRTKALGFLNTGRAVQTGMINIGKASGYTHAVCPLNYFTATVKQVLYSKLTMKNQGANDLPACGSTMQDKAGTVQGDWYDQKASSSQQGLDIPGALAFAHSNLDASMAEVSVGTDLVQSQYGGTQLLYVPQPSGYVNRDPSQIKPDGHVYCFDGNEGAILNSQGDRIHFDTELMSTKTLQIDYGSGSCAASPSLKNPITYSR